MPYRGSYEQSSNGSGGANFLGFQEVALTDVVDKSADYPNMDMFLEIYFRNGNSQYPWKYSLLGSFDREDDDTISGDSSLLKRILYFTDAIGWTGGVNTNGNWVDEDDKPILDEDDKEDIAGFLNSKYTQANYGVTSSNSEHKYYIFTYKKWNEKAKRAYTTVCPKIVKNDERSRTDLEDYVKYMKANKFIVEHDDTQKPVSNGDMTSTTTGSTFDKF
jgi:hypothetical protein|tara:strand:- start:182 stop:835 length:654 start_codon:yes stop_codon:yes gene_type:complete